MQIVLLAVLILVVVCVGAAADWNVVDFGAAVTAADNTEAFTKALDAAGKAGGGVVNVPAGQWAIKGNLSIPAGVTLQGTYRATPVMGPGEYKSIGGTVLQAYAGRGSQEGKPFIDLRSAACVAGMVIYYPEWKKTDVPPVPYPPCISADETNNVAVIDVNIMNAYEAIKFVRAHRHLIRNFQGYPIWRGIYVDQCYDIGRIENVHIWPFGTIYDPKDPYCEWINLNGTAFEFARTDWEYVTNTFCFGYGVGYKFSETKDGSANGNFLGIGADCCERAVLVEQCQGPGLLITNGEFVGRWSSINATTMEIGEKMGGKVSLTNCSFWGPIDRCVWMRSAKGQFTANACRFLDWDIKHSGAPAILLDAGRTILQGNDFGDGELHVRVGEQVASAIIMGNQAFGGLNIDSKAGDRMQALANEQVSKLTDQQVASYTVSIGSDGDRRVVRQWQGGEQASEWGSGTKRWSAPNAQLILPVLPNKDYDVEFDVYVPEPAMHSDAGIYLGEKRIVAFDKPGIQVLKGKITAGKRDKVVLDVECKGWVPKDVNKDSQDPRVLGIAMRSVTMRAIDAAAATPNPRELWQGF